MHACNQVRESEVQSYSTIIKQFINQVVQLSVKRSKKWRVHSFLIEL